MSSNGCWDEDQGSSRPHQRVRRTSMQAAKLSEDCVSSSQPAELQDKSSPQAKTVKMLVPWDDAFRRLMLVLAVVVMALVLLVQTLDRTIMNFWRACMHGRRGRLMKWGPHEWVLDSGAWNHHTSNLELLLEGGDFLSQEMDNKDAPSSADDAAAPDVLQGSVRTDCFDFPGVHYVGDDTRNVVSVSQLARDHGLVTVFEPTSCHVKDKKTGLIIGKGHLHNGMYMLDSLRIKGQYVGDAGASSGGEPSDGGGGGRGHGGRGNNGEGDSGTADGRGGGGRSRDGRGGGTGASRNQEQGGSGSGAIGGDINDEEIVTEELEKGSSENEIQEMNDDKEDNGKVDQEINGNGEEEDKERRGGGPALGGLLGLSSFACVLCMCITAACIFLLLCTIMGGRVICKLATFNKLDFHSLLGFPPFLFISGLQLLRALTMMQSTSRELVKQIGSLFRGRREEDTSEGIAGDCVQESSQEHNWHNRTTDPVGYWRCQFPARAFASSTNTARRPEEFFVDSGASFHTTWKESILFPYPRHLQNHTKPPTRSLGGIAAGSIAVKRSGYLNGNNIMLDGVLLALEAQANLVSVGQLSIYYGVQVEMDDQVVVIRKKRDGLQIGGGRMLNNLYVLEYFLPGGLFAHYCPTPTP